MTSSRPAGPRAAPARTLARRLAAGLIGIAVAIPAGPAPAHAATPATIRVDSADLGAAPAFGYNLGHLAEGSNALDWWRHSGARLARAFISPSEIEPSDDIAPVGDGVADLAAFMARRALVRSATVGSGTSSEAYVRWSSFVGRYVSAGGDTNRFTVDGAFTALRARGTTILANITASPSRFPLTGDGDWAGKWELWQHYYAQGFLMASRYGIDRYGIFNEPNNWTGMTPADWQRRLEVTADALRAGVADAAVRGAAVGPARIHAPTTANGASKYAEWGAPAILDRHRRVDGSVDRSWRNLDVYAYQKYSMTASGTPTAYAEDATALRAAIDADLEPGESLPLALTEFNVRTGSDYDARAETLDSPSDFTALAVNAIAVARRGVTEVYAFKFAQTARSGGTYPVAKNGMHYVENAGAYRYGGATRGAEAWRLVVAACDGGRRMLAATASAAGLAVLACRAGAGVGPLDLVVANPTMTAYALTLELGGLGIPSGARVTVSEVSARAAGGVVVTTTVSSERVRSLALPAQAVWRIRVTGAPSSVATVPVTADTVLGDGSAAGTTGGSATSLAVRSDGAPDRRRVTVLRFPLSALTANADRILLAVRAANLSRSGTYQAHLYGVPGAAWSEATATWGGAAFLRQGGPAGNRIAQNVVTGQGAGAFILGQLLTTSTTLAWYRIDVTDVVRSFGGSGTVTLLLVQDHRWDVALPSLASGDTQADGIRIASREAGGTSAARLEVHTVP